MYGIYKLLIGCEFIVISMPMISSKIDNKS